MSYPARRDEGFIDRLTNRAPSRVERQVQKHVAIEHGRGMVQAARVRSLEFVANQGMMAIGSISQMEAVLVNATPHAAGRLQAIADTFAAGVANIITDTARGD